MRLPLDPSKTRDSRSSGHHPVPRNADRGTFGGAYGILFSIVVVTSAITATVTLPGESIGPDRPHDEVDAIGAGLDAELGDANRAIRSRSAIEAGTPESMRNAASLRATSDHRPTRLTHAADLIPSSELDRIPAPYRARLRERLIDFVGRTQTGQSNAGKITRINPAGTGVVPGVTIEQHDGYHQVEREVVEPYTVEKRALDYHVSVIDSYQSRWDIERPGPDWERTDGTKDVVVDRDTKWAAQQPGSEWTSTGDHRETVIDRQYQWATTRPGNDWIPTGRREQIVTDVERDWSTKVPAGGWQRTGRSRTQQVDTKYQESSTKPGPGWKQVDTIGTEQIRTGTRHRYLWSNSRNGAGVYTHLLGYTHLGITNSAQFRAGTESAYRWERSKRARDRSLQLAGYRYAGIKRTKNVETGTETQWRWADASPPGRKWRRVSRAKLFRGYRTHIGTSKPAGRNWQRLGVHHVETRESFHYETRKVWGWYDIVEYAPHEHYETKRIWVPARTEVVKTREWKSGHYKTVKKRTWVGWKTVRKKKWVRGRWKKKKVRKKVTRWKKQCKWKWSWRRGFYKTCSRKKVTRHKTVTKKRWLSGHWKRTNKRKWVGWKTVKKKKWVPGHYKTKSKKKRIKGHWAKDRVKTGVHYHKVTKPVWGSHKQRVRVVTTRKVKHYKWRKPIYDWKIKYARPRYETRYQHQYNRPTYETRYKHHYTKPTYSERPVYRWKKAVHRTKFEFVKKTYGWKHQYVLDVTQPEFRWIKEETRPATLWRKPVYRDEPVYQTVLVPKERTKTVMFAVESAPFTYDSAGNWTLATGVSRVRDASIRVDRTLLTSDDDRPFSLRLTGDHPRESWTMSAWRDGDTIVIRTNPGRRTLIDAPSATVNFDTGTINGDAVAIDFADGLTGPYSISIRNGTRARGTYAFTLVGEPTIDSRPAALADDRAAISVQDGIVYAATFDVTYETDATTYTDRLTIEPDIGGERVDVD